MARDPTTKALDLQQQRQRRAEAVRRLDPARRRRLAEAVAIWGSIVLGSLVLLAGLLVWHLSRRGRLIRERLGSPRGGKLGLETEDEPVPPAPEPTEPSSS